MTGRLKSYLPNRQLNLSNLTTPFNQVLFRLLNKKKTSNKKCKKLAFEKEFEMQRNYPFSLKQTSIEAKTSFFFIPFLLYTHFL